MYPYSPASGVLTIEELSERVAALERVLFDSVDHAAGLRSATTVVDTGVGVAPTVGQVLTATGADAATWQSLPAGPPTDAAAGTASLRTLGTGAQQACGGADARLSDARTPTAHHTSHEAGGGDVVALPLVTTTANGVVAAIPAANVSQYSYYGGDGLWHDLAADWGLI